MVTQNNIYESDHFELNRFSRTGSAYAEYVCLLKTSAGKSRLRFSLVRSPALRSAFLYNMTHIHILMLWLCHNLSRIK